MAARKLRIHTLKYIESKANESIAALFELQQSRDNITKLSTYTEVPCDRRDKKCFGV